MTAGRLYVVQSWSNAAAYSGEQIGTRLAQSKELHFTRDGKANTALYADEPEKAPKSSKVRRSLVESISLPDSHLSRLEKLSERLESEANTISMEEYAYLRKSLDERIEKATKRLFKARGWDKKEETYDRADRFALPHTEAPIEKFDYPKENMFVKFFSKVDVVVMSCSDDNGIKQGWKKVRKYLI